MAPSKRIARPLECKLRSLEAHMLFIRQHLSKLAEDERHVKVIAAELRVLACSSSGTEGLLWRLADEVGVDDGVFVHAPGNLIKDHPLAYGLQFLIVPMVRGGKGDPQLPADVYPLKEIIKRFEALIVEGTPLTHETLIKKVSEQMGTAHEDEGLEPALVSLEQILIGGTQPIVTVLKMDAELVLEVAERVLEVAEAEGAFERRSDLHGYGDVTVVARYRMDDYVLGQVPLFRLHSYVADVDLRAFTSPAGIRLEPTKHGKSCDSLLAAYPDGWTPGEDCVFAFSYCSRAREARTITNGRVNGSTCTYDMGWLHAAELYMEEIIRDPFGVIEARWVSTYERLLPTGHVAGLLALPPDGYGVWKTVEELEAQGVFPDDDDSVGPKGSQFSGDHP